MGCCVLTLGMDEDSPPQRVEGRIKAGAAFVFFEAGWGWLGTLFSLHSSAESAVAQRSPPGPPCQNFAATCTPANDPLLRKGIPDKISPPRVLKEEE